MSSTSNSTKKFKTVGVDVPYIQRWGRDRNPCEIVSVGALWQPINFVLPAAAAADAPVVNPRHQITYAYYGPLINGARDPTHAGTAHQRAKVRATIKEWERYAHVSFVNTIGDANVTDAAIRISFVPNDGNWSLVGPEHELCADIDDKTMNLGNVAPAGAFATDYERHVILHEFGHSLGLLHEHQSPAREGVLNIEPSCARYIQRGWSPGMVEGDIRRQNKLSEITSYSELDLNSVMAYATSGNEDIYAELKPELSEMDKAYMVINYPRLGERLNSVYPRDEDVLVEVDDRAWTMAHALDTAGLTEAAWPQVRESILTRYANLNAERIKEIREIFGEWTKARREEERAARAAAAAAAEAEADSDSEAEAEAEAEAEPEPEPEPEPEADNK